jgi:hypothetical protein
MRQTFILVAITKIIVVEWYGFYFNGENENLYTRNSDLLQIDDGEEILNYKLFDDIPDNAICCSEAANSKNTRVQIFCVRGKN